jgi:4-amino-4-deoxy-L-arabinose transferase-like glycosyltransferase
LISAGKNLATVAALCGALTLAAIIFRPALPIDETRYLTAAWEMFLNHNYFLPTLNFRAVPPQAAAALLAD